MKKNPRQVNFHAVLVDNGIWERRRQIAIGKKASSTPTKYCHFDPQIDQPIFDEIMGMWTRKRERTVAGRVIFKNKRLDKTTRERCPYVAWATEEMLCVCVCVFDKASPRHKKQRKLTDSKMVYQADVLSLVANFVRHGHGKIKCFGRRQVGWLCVFVPSARALLARRVGRPGQEAQLERRAHRTRAACRHPPVLVGRTHTSQSFHLMEKKLCLMQIIYK